MRCKYCNAPLENNDAAADHAGECAFMNMDRTDFVNMFRRDAKADKINEQLANELADIRTENERLTAALEESRSENEENRIAAIDALVEMETDSWKTSGNSLFNRQFDDYVAYNFVAMKQQQKTIDQLLALLAKIHDGAAQAPGGYLITGEVIREIAEVL